MTYFYTNDWTMNTDELLNAVPQLVDVASKWNCALYSTPVYESDGYVIERFLLQASQEGEAKSFMDDSVRILKGVDWKPVTEDYFKEQTMELGHIRPSLNKVKLDARPEFNLWKVINIWYAFAVKNDQLVQSYGKPS